MYLLGIPKGRKQKVSEYLKGLVFGLVLFYFVLFCCGLLFVWFFFLKIQIHYQNKEIHNEYDVCRAISNAVDNI